MDELDRKLEKHCVSVSDVSQLEMISREDDCVSVSNLSHLEISALDDKCVSVSNFNDFVDPQKRKIESISVSEFSELAIPKQPR